MQSLPPPHSGAGPFRFGLSSEDCELLMALETSGSLVQLGQVLGKDISVVSRQLQRLSQRAPVLEKHRGRWRLSLLGKDMVTWARDAAATQNSVLKKQSVIRIATTREFGARILAPRIEEFLNMEEGTILSFVTLEDGVEQALIDGRADLGLDCGRPEDPLISFKNVVVENFTVVVSPCFLKKHSIKDLKELRPPTKEVHRREFAPKLIFLPHLQYRRATAPTLMGLSYEIPNIVSIFNDIATVREACVVGAGWAVIPRYAVKKELDRGELLEVSGWKMQPEKFGVWWLRGRTAVLPWAKRSIRWLKGMDLN